MYETSFTINLRSRNKLSDKEARYFREFIRDIVDRNIKNYKHDDSPKTHITSVKMDTEFECNEIEKSLRKDWDQEGCGPCPKCGSNDIRWEHAACLCGHYGDDSCWTYPICNTCGFTSGPASANSGGESWEPFT